MFMARVQLSPSAELEQLETDYMTYSLIRKYVTKTMKVFYSREALPGEHNSDGNQLLAEKIFDKLTHRKFSYLSKKKINPYKTEILSRLRESIIRNQPVRFYYDLGPGYHASIDPENRQLTYNVGFAEIMALRQIHLFCQEIGRFYRYGAVFHLVIDNLCAYFTNDISIEKTSRYVEELRELIDELGCQAYISVLAESEQFSVEEYEYYFNESKNYPVGHAISSADIENVCRFLGRNCSPLEAAQRIARYQKAGEITEKLLQPIVKGIRLTQRATSSTLGFRSFPGSDQRIQVGQLALKVNINDAVQPSLITSKNYTLFRLHQLDFPEILPAGAPTVPFAAVI